MPRQIESSDKQHRMYGQYSGNCKCNKSKGAVFQQQIAGSAGAGVGSELLDAVPIWSHVMVISREFNDFIQVFGGNCLLT